MARFFRGVAMVGAIVSDLGSLYIVVKVFMVNSSPYSPL
jgi:hypothetical protein